jgi:hypothetical protein
MLDADTPPSHRIRSVMSCLSPVQHGQEVESRYVSCDGSTSSCFRDLYPFDMPPYGFRGMESLDTVTCPSCEEGVGSRHPGIEDDASSPLCRVESSQSVAVCALHDWELLDDPTVDYCHLFASPGRRQAKQFDSALLVLYSFTLPLMFVFLISPCLHVIKRERNLWLLHCKSRCRLELMFFMHVRVAVERMHCNNWTQTTWLLQYT